MFSFFQWITKRRYTADNLVRGSDNIDELRRRIKSAAHMLVSNVHHSTFLSAVNHKAVKELFLGSASNPITRTEAMWLLQWAEKKQLLDLRCVVMSPIDKTSCVFSTLEPREVPSEFVILAYEALRRVPEKVCYELVGVAPKLQPFIDASRYKL